MEQPTFFYLLLAFGIFASAGAAYFFRKSEKAAADLGVERTLTENLQNLVHAKEQEVDELSADVVKQKQEVAAATARVEEKQKDIKKRDEDLSKLRKRIDDDSAKITELETSKVRIQTEAEQREKATAEQIKHLSDLQEDMKLKFEKVVNDGLKNQGEAFTKNSIAKLKAELDPFKTNVDKFEKELRAVNQSAKTERELLQSAIGQVNAQAKHLAEDAVNLTKALKGDARQRGAWGEGVLQRILETSGLRKGEEYEIQVSRTDEDGKRLRPDVVVNLPEGKTLVIDAKVSLLAYQELVGSEDEAQSEKLRKQIVASFKAHIDDLSSKNYPLAEGKTLDYVIMFVPIEGAFAEAMSFDGELTEYAVSKDIVLATPTTLTVALKTAASIWHFERRNKNAEEIARQVGLLYNKIHGFLESMDKVGKHLGHAQDSYTKAVGQLHTGSGNIVAKAEKLRQLGAATTKTIATKSIGDGET